MAIPSRGLTTIVLAAILALAATSSCSTGTDTGVSQVQAFDLELGDCFNAEGSTEVERVEVVDCDELHDFEIYHTFQIADGPYPGPRVLEDEWIQGCLARFEVFVGSTFDESALDISAIFPTEESWEQLDDREVLCSVTAVDSLPRQGSAQGSGV